MFTVTQALATLNISKDVLNVIQNRDDVWDTFGKKNSHLLRAKLFKLFDSENMSQGARIMIFILFSAIKNVGRVKEHLDNLPDDIKALKELAEAKNFIDKRLVQYTTQENLQKFAVVHLPTTMPGLDILLMAIMYEYNESFLMEDIVGKQTFAQMDIDADLQKINEEYQKEFWNEVVTTSKNPNQDAYRQNKGFNQKFYDTSKNDQYEFLNADLSIYKTPKGGMTEDELHKWYNKVKGGNNKKTVTPATSATSSSTTMPSRT